MNQHRIPRKAAIGLVFPVVIGLALALGAFYSLQAIKNPQVYANYIGKVVLDATLERNEALTQLNFILKSAYLASDEVLYPLAKEGFYYSPSSCGGLKDYSLWENFNEVGSIYCYPTKEAIKSNYEKLFNQKLNSRFESYKELGVPRDNYKVYIKDTDPAILRATAMKPVQYPFESDYKDRTLAALPQKERDCAQKKQMPLLDDEGNMEECIKCPKTPSCTEYKEKTYCQLDPCDAGCKWQEGKCQKSIAQIGLKPSFNKELDYNFVKEFWFYSENTRESVNDIKDCLAYGSYKQNDPDDLNTCIKKSRFGMSDDYKIKQTTLTNEYTLLVELKARGFYAPDSLFVRYGIRFPDTFTPPPTQIKGIEGEDLVWYINNASDVIFYEIFYTEIASLGGEEIPSRPAALDKFTNYQNPIRVSLRQVEMEENMLRWKISYENTGLEAGKSYYFYIRAIDNANNYVSELDADPVKLVI